MLANGESNESAHKTVAYPQALFAKVKVFNIIICVLVFLCMKNQTVLLPSTKSTIKYLIFNPIKILMKFVFAALLFTFNFFQLTKEPKWSGIAFILWLKWNTEYSLWICTWNKLWKQIVRRKMKERFQYIQFVWWKSKKFLFRVQAGSRKRLKRIFS